MSVSSASANIFAGMSLKETLDLLVQCKNEWDNKVINIKKEMSDAIANNKFELIPSLIEQYNEALAQSVKFTTIVDSNTFKDSLKELEEKKQPEQKKLQGLVFHEYYVTLVGGMIGQDSRRILVDSVQKEKIVRLFLHIWENYTTNKSKVFDILVGDYWTKYTKQQAYVPSFLNHNWNIEFLKNNVKKYINNANTVNKTTIAFLNRL